MSSLPLPDPALAPRRTDLPYLRRRTLRAAPRPVVVSTVVPPPAPKPAPPPAPKAPPAAAPVPAPAPATPPPTPARAAAAPAPAPSTDLNLSPTTPAPTRRAAAPAAKAAPGPAPRRTGPATDRRALPVRDARRASNAIETRLSASAPAVTLTRTQSGTGALLAQIRGAAGTPGLTVGCVVQLANGSQWLVHEGSGGHGQAPLDDTLPLVRVRAGDAEDSIVFDLRRVGELRRALVYVMAGPAATPVVGGHLEITTYGGASIDVPFDVPPTRTLALVSIHNVAGELVIRAEADEAADPPSAWRSHGYEIAGLG